MATLKELRDVRIQKLNKLRELGIDPYPSESSVDTNIEDILVNYDNMEGETVTVAGRIFTIREHGKLSFMDLKDSTGRVQLYIKQQNISDRHPKKGFLSYEDLQLLDSGDFIEVNGQVTKTKSGQISVEVKSLKILTKSLRPLADKWEGLKNKEVRLRRRYLDTTVNDDVYQRFIRRSKFWQATRNFLNSKGFLEMNIPVLEHTIGGADATPFVTHMESMGQDFYLRISQELFLKRLIGGGYSKVYEIGPRFRNEGLSDEHLPEHIAIEFYWAYANWEEGMELIKEMFNYILDEVYDGQKVFQIRGFEVDFSNGWETLDFAEIMKNRFGVDIHNTNLKEVQKLLKENGSKDAQTPNLNRAIDSLWKVLRKEIAGPAFLINHPKFLSPLSKAKLEEPHVTERLQPIIAGSELGNGWSEINDPQDQLERFLEQQALRDSGDSEAQMLDIDYVEMLEYGMPPTFGWGHSERVFWFLEDVTAREGVPFPQLKHEIDDTTKEIYGLWPDEGDEESDDQDEETDD